MGHSKRGWDLLELVYVQLSSVVHICSQPCGAAGLRASRPDHHTLRIGIGILGAVASEFR